MYLQTLSQLSMNLKTREGSRSFHQRMFGIHILHSQEEEKIIYQGNTKFEEEDLWRIANGRRRGSVGVQACECL
uniref:Putative ovule protein n=1 Tax=Solanum chacoense TaxID=4108 RepID=A0A0V0HWP2_SOLCH